jgi:Flp pilus assembly protein TadD
MKRRIDTLALNGLETAKAAEGPGTVAQARELQNELDAGVATSVTSLDRCIAIMPWDWRPRMLKNEILLTFDKFAEAEQNARQALEIEPDNPNYLRMLAQVQNFRRMNGEDTARVDSQ